MTEGREDYVDEEEDDLPATIPDAELRADVSDGDPSEGEERE